MKSNGSNIICVVPSREAVGYSVMLTAGHGNCEEMVDPLTGEAQTQQTAYPVPCMIIDQENWKLSCSGGLANVAPTVLQLMGIKKPGDMTATSLLLQSFKRDEYKMDLVKLQGVA